MDETRVQFLCGGTVLGPEAGGGCGAVRSRGTDLRTGSRQSGDRQSYGDRSDSGDFVFHRYFFRYFFLYERGFHSCAFVSSARSKSEFRQRRWNWIRLSSNTVSRSSHR
jgi:hypothetical protein